MNKSLENLALRKQLLQARSALCRLRIRHEINTLHDSLSWTRAGVMAVKALPLRSALFGLVLSSVSHGRLSRLLALAARTLFLVRLARTALSLLQKISTPPASVRERTDRAGIDL